MKCRNDLTAEYVRECLDYEPDTGLLKWKKRPVEHFKNKRSCNIWNTRYAGKNAGYFVNIGYFNIRVNGKTYRAHRIIWLITYGQWPKNHIARPNRDMACNLDGDRRLICPPHRNPNSCPSFSFSFSFHFFWTFS